MKLQEVFSSAVLDSQQPCPGGVVSRNGHVESRFAVYRNNVQRGLINALAFSYPVVSMLVGKDFFQEMARLFIKHSPPDNPVMSTYGIRLADFISNFAPASSLPYLADIARLERLCVDAYHAADASAVNPQALAQMLHVPESLDQLHLQLHPSVATLDSPYAVADLWATHQSEGQCHGYDLNLPQSTVVLRYGLSVEVFAVRPGYTAFINHLQGGYALGPAAEHALHVDPYFDLSKALALLIAHGAITDLSLPPEISP